MTTILHLSTFLKRPMYDQDGGRIGRVQDLVARLGDDAHPPIVGAVIKIEGRNTFVPIRKIGGLADGRMTFQGCLLYTSPSPRDRQKSRMPSSA